MKELTKTEIKKIYGGGISAGVYAAITAGLSFIIGIFDGLIKLK